jgi:hypothetical protein
MENVLAAVLVGALYLFVITYVFMHGVQPAFQDVKRLVERVWNGPKPKPVTGEIVQEIFIESIKLNTLEHQALEPRSIEEWNHSPQFCPICHPKEFKRLRRPEPRLPNPGRHPANERRWK